MKEIENRLDELGVCEEVKDNVLSILAAPDDFKIVRRLREPQVVAGSEGVKRVMFLDSETTGVNTAEDEMIELGYVIVEFSNVGELGEVVRIYDELNQPRLPIMNSEIHGITNEMVAGKKIDFDEVAADLANVNLVVAHNSGFDRKIVERYLPAFADVPWACTFKDVDWAAKGIKGAKLEYLAYESNFFYNAHRAVIDVYAMVEVVRYHKVFKELLIGALTPQYIVSAQGSPFSKKDLLKERGYKPLYVAGKFICWYTAVLAASLEAEKAWLLKDAGCKNVPVKEVGSIDRYSVREQF